MKKKLSSRLATLASIMFLSLSLLLGACNTNNDESSKTQSVKLDAVFSSLFKSSAAQGYLAFAADQIMAGQMQVANTATSEVQTFDWTIYMDETAWATQSNKSIVLDPGNYDFSLLVTKGSHQYAGTTLNVAIVDGENTVPMTVRPIIGDTETTVDVVARLADLKFQYSTTELNAAGFANPQVGIIVDGGAEQIFAINPATGISDNYVNLSDGVHSIQLKLYDGAVQRGRSVVVQETQDVVFGNDIAMDMVALHGEMALVLTEDGGDAVFNFSVPDEVIDEAGGVGNLQTVFKFTSSRNATFDDVSLTLTPDGSGDYTGTHTHNGVQYDDPATLTLEFTDTAVTPNELLGSCVIADAALNNAPQSKVCELTLRRRAVVGGDLLAALGVNVMDASGEAVAGASVYAGETLLGLTSSGSFGTPGYLKAYLKADDYIIRAELDVNSGDASVSLGPLEIENLEITLHSPVFDQHTTLLLHGDMDGQNILDYSQYSHIVNANGDASQSSAESVFGGKSLYFDGDGDYLSIPDSENLHIDVGAIDFWAYVPSWTTDSMLFVKSVWEGYLQYTGVSLAYHAVGNVRTVDFGAPSVGAWHHYAIVATGTQHIAFLDGVEVSRNNTTLGLLGTGDLHIGEGEGGIFSFNGYIDEFRLSKGIARWTSDFTPPNVPY